MKEAHILDHDTPVSHRPAEARMPAGDLMRKIIAITQVTLDGFFFQAEDGIRDYKVTGVQTCALPICLRRQRRKLAPAPASLRSCCRPRRPVELRGSQKNSRAALLAAIGGRVLGLSGLHVPRLCVHLMPFVVLVMVPHPRHAMLQPLFVASLWR